MCSAACRAFHKVSSQQAAPLSSLLVPLLAWSSNSHHVQLFCHVVDNNTKALNQTLPMCTMCIDAVFVFYLSMYAACMTVLTMPWSWYGS